jgi:polar amino acid transport system substrate-binding protein
MKRGFVAAAVLAGLGLAAITASTTAQSMMAKIGNCEVSGKKGEFPFKPAIAGQLTLEVNLPAPIFYNGDTPETIKDGLEYCFAANIAHRAGLDKVVVKNVAWDALVAGQTKSFDLALSQISITDERKKVVEFSTPYFASDIGVLVKKGTKVTAASIKTLRIGVQQGTTGADFAAKTLKAKTVKVFPDTPGMFTALQAGQIDVAMTDTAIVLGQAKASDGVFEVVAQYKTGESYGALFPKGNPNNKVINQIIAALIKDGTVGKLTAQYFGMDPTKIAVFKP